MSWIIFLKQMGFSCRTKIVTTGCEVNHPWLQDGYKKFKDAPDTLKYVDCVDEKRTESAFYHPISKPETRVGIMKTIPETRYLSGFPGFLFVF